MSEKTEKTIVELKKEDRDLLKLAIKTVGKSKVEPETGAHKGGNHTLEELVDCPDCYPKIRSLVFKKHAEETKDSGVECEDCGTHVKQEWESCPTCGGKNSRSR